jgi:hypothetical protein
VSAFEAVSGRLVSAPDLYVGDRRLLRRRPPVCARAHGNKSGRPRKVGRDLLFAVPYFPIIDLALSGVIAVVGTVTVVGTLSAQSSRIDFAISIASGPPVG